MRAVNLFQKCFQFFRIWLNRTEAKR